MWGRRKGKRLTRRSTTEKPESNSESSEEEESSQEELDEMTTTEVTVGVVPPTFAGRPQEDVDAFLGRFDRAAEANRWTANTKAVQLPCYLRGSAADWYERQAVAPANYSELANALRATFRDTAGAERSYAALLSREQEVGEAPLSYLQEILRLCHRAAPEMSEAEKIRHILRGLQHDVYERVAILSNASLVELRENIGRVETALALRKQRTTREVPRDELSEMRKEVEELRRRLGQQHLARPPVANHGESFLNRPRNPRPRPPLPGRPRGPAQERGPGRLPDGRVVCYRCNGTGHFARNCPGNH